MNLRETIRRVATELETEGPTQAKELVKDVRKVLVERGLTPPCHRGVKNMTPDQTLEWFAGEFVDIVESETWHAMNSWLNSVDRFAPSEKDSHD